MNHGEKSPVQTVIGTLYSGSMSATRLNGFLQSAMREMIAVGVKFEIDDVAEAMKGRQGGYWTNTEDWYSSACGKERGDGGGNLSAALSLEKYLGRAPFIWAERAKTPSRLCVGSQLTWKGERVTVTSFDDQAKTLVACSYTQEEDRGEHVGKLTYAMGAYRIVEARADYEDGSVALRYSAEIAHERKIKRRFCISNEEMKTVRADYDARRRKHEKAINAAATLDELQEAQDAAAGEGQSAYRHFDLEILNAAIQARRGAIINGMPREEVEKREREKNDADLADWLAGGCSRPFFSGIIRLRIKDEFVECSNGNKVSLDAALKTLPLVHRYRDKGWERNGQVHDVDAYRLERINASGVKIGCTLIAWEEVDRFTPILKAAKRRQVLR